MRHALVAAMAAKVALFLSLAPVAGAAPCPAGTTSMDVATTAELKLMINTINCTGEGVFDVTWIGSVPVVQIIEVCEKKQLTVTGATPAPTDTDLPSAVIDAGSTTGIFRVCNGSTLALNNLMLDGGISTNGAAIDARASSAVYVTDCAFTNNNATTGGAIYAHSSEVYIHGDTVFADNSAEDNGGAIFAENTKMRVDGTISFANNSAGNEGGAVYASSSEVKLVGESFFGYNSVGASGGALFVCNCSTNISGSTTFVHHYAGEGGGAVSAYDSEIYVDGKSSFGSNSAVEEGGALFAKDSNVRIQGETWLEHNSAGDTGGAISAARSNISLDGWTTITNNSALDDGGAVYMGPKSILFLSGESQSRYNSGGRHGGVICIRGSKMYVDGNNAFTNNSVVERGGAITSYGSEIYISGTALFTHNSAGGDGGAVAWVGSDVDINGHTSFGYNSANVRGGAFFSGNANVRMAGQTWFGYNSAASSGGAVQAHTAPVFFEGNTTFIHNIAHESGGALNYYTGEGVDFLGISTFSHNVARWRGGAVNVIAAALRITGTTSFLHNTGYDGGGVVAHQTPVVIDGNAAFVNNSADHDGGALNILGANATMTGTMEFSANTALNGGGIFSALSPNFKVLGTASFVRNFAKFYGGAISLTDPEKVNITGSTYKSNKGASGGAVAITSTEGTAGGFERCRFDSNDATNGGALYLSTGHTDGTDQTENVRFVQDSAFLHNVAVESGGALYNAGVLAVSSTVFTENIAGEGGLAIHDEGSYLVLENVTFTENMFSCPVDQYADAHHESGVDGTCRFELVCQQCSEGCEVNDGVAKVTADAVPVCEEIPEGVARSSATTLATFDLLEGHYRVSDQSRVIRECYVTDACAGGTDHRNYCAVGYTGPYCAVCADGYAPGVLGHCHECSTENRRWTVGIATAAFILLVFVAVMVVYRTLRGSEHEVNLPCPQMFLCCQRVFRKGLPLAAIKIVVVVWQIITQFTEVAGAVYPEEYEAFLAKLTVINLDIGSILSNSCIFTTDFYDRLLLATVGPVVVLLVLFGTLSIARRRSTSTEAAAPILQSKRASTGLFILFFVYSSVSYTVFQTFVCDDLDDGMSFLRADYSIACSTARHAAYRAYAIGMVFVYPVGIPVFYGWWLMRNQRDLKKPGREQMTHLTSFRSLWGAYTPSCYYYEVVECCRRIVLTGAAVFVLPNSVEQIAIIFLLAVVFTFISESLSPFETKADMWLYRWGNAIILASMYVALILKAELTDVGSTTSSVMTVLLIAANILLIVTVAVQTALLVKGLYTPAVVERVFPTAPTTFWDESRREPSVG